MKLSRPEITKAIGEELATGDNEEQTVFFNAFFKDLYRACDRGWGMQTYYIAKGLTPRAKEGLKELVRDIEAQEEE